MSDSYSLFLDRPDNSHMPPLMFHGMDSVPFPLPPADTALCNTSSDGVSDFDIDPLHVSSLLDFHSYSYQLNFDQINSFDAIPVFQTHNNFQQCHSDRLHSIVLDSVGFDNIVPMPVYPSPNSANMPQGQLQMESMMATSYFPPMDHGSVQSNSTITHNFIRAASMTEHIDFGMPTSGGGSANTTTTFVATHVEEAFDMNPLKFMPCNEQIPTSSEDPYRSNVTFPQMNHGPGVQGFPVNTVPHASDNLVNPFVKTETNHSVANGVSPNHSNNYNNTNHSSTATRTTKVKKRMPKRKSVSESRHTSPQDRNLVSPKNSLASLGMKPTTLSPARPMHQNPTAISRPSSTEMDSFKIVRGITSGGSSTRPPTQERPGYKYVPLELVMEGALTNEVCLQEWNKNELKDRRRIVRIERSQKGSVLHALFLIVGLAISHPEPIPAAPGTEIIEFSCLDCYSSEVSEDFGTRDREFYVTSVEIVAIIEMLIGILDTDLLQRRKERGRIRSNLTPFWLKKPVSSKKNADNDLSNPRLAFARRIMAYDVRKPRGFDKDVRILPWDNLIPALTRALQCYYVEVPE